MSDLNFESLLATYNQDFKDAEEFGQDWYPPDAEYVASIIGCKKGVSTKKDSPVGWWKVTARIEDAADEDLDGKEFCLGFYRTSAMGILKSGARALNGGEPVGSLPDANEVFEGSVGQIVRVKVTTTHKDDGRSFTNCYVQEVLATEEVADTPVDPSDPGPTE